MKSLAKITNGKLQQCRRSARNHRTPRIESWKGVKEGTGKCGLLMQMFRNGLYVQYY